MDALILRVPLEMIPAIILKSALTDTSTLLRQLMNEEEGVMYSDVYSYYAQFLCFQRNKMLLRKVLLVRAKLGYAFAFSKTGGLTKIYQHRVGRLVWSFLGPDESFPKLRVVVPIPVRWGQVHKGREALSVESKKAKN
jgi:hypothetical protein